jgi:hypothetical protein
LFLMTPHNIKKVTAFILTKIARPIKVYFIKRNILSDNKCK